MADNTHADDRFQDIPKEFLGDGTVGGEMEALVAIMARLRAPDGCPWDHKQTHESLRPYILEETYEVLETIDKGDYDNLGIELGDLLLQIVFHGQIGAEAGRFTIVDSIRSIREKLIERHPHVFGELKLETAQDVRDNWEKIKLTNGKEHGERKTTLGGVPDALPALTRAFRVQEKMGGVGFDWESPDGALEKLKEEVEETSEAILSRDPEAAEEEIGDLLFSVVNAARLMGFGAEEALRKSINKVIKRFNSMEAMVNNDGRFLPDMNLDEMDEYWEKAKKLEKEGKLK